MSQTERRRQLVDCSDAADGRRGAPVRVEHRLRKCVDADDHVVVAGRRGAAGGRGEVRVEHVLERRLHISRRDRLPVREPQAAAQLDGVREAVAGDRRQIFGEFGANRRRVRLLDRVRVPVEPACHQIEERPLGGVVREPVPGIRLDRQGRLQPPAFDRRLGGGEPIVEEVGRRRIARTRNRRGGGRGRSGRLLRLARCPAGHSRENDCGRRGQHERAHRCLLAAGIGDRDDCSPFARLLSTVVTQRPFRRE